MQQVVHINRLGTNSIEFDIDNLEISISSGEERSLELAIINYGTPTHIHVSVSDSIKQNVTILEDNPYVIHEEYIPIIVRIPYDGKKIYEGQCFITVNHGAKKDGFLMIIGKSFRFDNTTPIEIDEDLIKSHNKHINPSRKIISKIPCSILQSNYETLIVKLLIGIVGLFIILLLISLIIRNYNLLELLGNFYSALLVSIFFTTLCIFVLMKLSFKDR